MDETTTEVTTEVPTKEDEEVDLDYVDYKALVLQQTKVTITGISYLETNLVDFNMRKQLLKAVIADSEQAGFFTDEDLIEATKMLMEHVKDDNLYKEKDKIMKEQVRKLNYNIANYVFNIILVITVSALIAFLLIEVLDLKYKVFTIITIISVVTISYIYLFLRKGKIW